MEHRNYTESAKKNRHEIIKNRNVIHYFKTIVSPIGPITITATDSYLTSLMWGATVKKSLTSVELKKSNAIITKTERQLKEYFSNNRKTFDIPLSTTGTDFQKQVWEELTKIPYGETISYGEQARRMSKPNATRAVGAANGKNPIGIIIPCHRVIGSNGTLTGFAGGIEVKRRLLAIEGIII